MPTCLGAHAAVPSGVVAAGVQQRMAERRRVILTPSRDPVPILVPHDDAVRVQTRTTIAAVGLLLDRDPTRRYQAKLASEHRLRRILLPTGCTSRMLVRERAAGVVLDLVAGVRTPQVLISDSSAAIVRLRGHFCISKALSTSCMVAA